VATCRLPKNKTKRGRRNRKKKRQNRPKLWAPLLKALGTTLGSSLGGPVGGALGGAVGSEAGDFFARLTGVGDYKVHQNSLTAGGGLTSVPRFGRSKIRVKHTEFISDIRGTIDFNLAIASAINPGNTKLFPWLSRIANHYEKWKPHGLVFIYRSTSGSATGSDTSLGSVVMATNYDVHDDTFGNKREMEAYEFCSSGGPDHDAMHPIECKSSTLPLKQYFVSPHAENETDEMFYTPGKFQLATVGNQLDDTTLGELWVAYDMELSTPKLSSAVGGILWHASGEVMNNQYIMRNPETFAGSSHEIHVGYAGGYGTESIYIAKTGYYLVTLDYKGDSPASRATNFTPHSGCTDITNTCGFWFNQTPLPLVQYPDVGDLVDRVIIHVTSDNARLLCGQIATSSPADGSWAFITVQQLPSQMIEETLGARSQLHLQPPLPTPVLHRTESKSTGRRTPR